MTDTLTIPRQLDPVAARDHAQFGRVFVLSGLALSPLPGQIVADHPMYPAWNDTGHLVYRCGPDCRAHSVLAEPADVHAWSLYCAEFGINPNEVTDPADRRTVVTGDVGHAVLAADADPGPVVGLGWLTFPTLHTP